LTDRPLPPADSPQLRRRGFVLAYGENDQPAWIRQGRKRVEAAGQAGAKTEVRLYPGAGHLIPPDLDERLPEWVSFIEKASGG
jgi:predicted esterase